MNRLQQLKKVYEDYKNKGVKGIFLDSTGVYNIEFEEDAKDELFMELILKICENTGETIEQIMFLETDSVTELAKTEEGYLLH